MDHQDRRGWPRITVDECVVHLSGRRRPEDGNAPVRLHCPVVDLSEGGVRLTSETFLPVGRDLRLVFEGKLGSEVPFPATVRWVREKARADFYSLGCSFKSRDPRRLAEVRALLHANRRAAEPDASASQSSGVPA